MSLWQRDKEAYRRRYYENEIPVETKEIMYGKKIAKILEMGKFDDHPTLKKIPRYTSSEHRIECLIGDIPFVGVIDSYEPDTFKFIEYKTGRNNVNGTARWDQVTVKKTDQLPIYSLIIKEKYGHVDNLTQLVWLRTIRIKKTIEFDQMILESDGDDVQLDGHVEIFKRRIFKWERNMMKEKIISLAREIEIDYDSYRRTHPRTLSGNE